MEFKALEPQNKIDKIRLGYSAPSNIALVKYWGKYPQQIPANPSISFTLQNCKTETFLESRKLPKSTSRFEVEVYVDGRLKQDFKPKIIQFLQRIEPYFSFLKDYSFKVNTENTFPHSSGIASSASGFAALAACLVRLEQILAQQEEPPLNTTKTSFIARLGSGSASRSISGPMMVWGKHSNLNQSSNEIAVKHDDVDDIFKTYQDVILLVDKGQKKVSSSLGHDLMNNHPFAQSRFQQAQNNLSELLEVLKVGDLARFIEITESEALSLHAMMLCSQPYYILMKPNTLKIIEHIWEFRQKTSIPVSFTLDAGANVHVLFPKDHKTKVLEFINTNLIGYCQNEQYICDQVGGGIDPLT
ncbi:diphosphomevalonate decarboxylase [Flavobacteriaceae bacterium 14752]|uniref:diphosphomevalonate decarboxylase n=1 Tax=Mesohalobacter salilacus TaxID=2491711 RepID=UPI000F633918|nr:diphosphomevalonate decarboxylase [Flavobacteriaceae bacterium 14752]